MLLAIFEKGITLFHIMSMIRDIATPDTKFYESAYTLEYTSDMLTKGETSFLDPIKDMYNEETEVVAVSSMCHTDEPITFIEFVDLFNKLPQNVPIERDVEDGYVYNKFTYIFYNGNTVVLGG